MKAMLLIVMVVLGMMLTGCCTTGYSGCGGNCNQNACQNGPCDAGACSSSGNDPYSFGLWSSENHPCGSTGVACCCYYDNVGSRNFPFYPRD